MQEAWRFTGTNEPLTLSEVEAPTPGRGEIVVDVRAAGLCHTDVGVLHDQGWLSLLATRPITMGHEVAGVIAAVGDGVDGWQVGDRVGLCPTTSVGAPGFNYDGGFGEQVRVGQEALVRIPDEVSMAQGAAGTDAGMTSYHAVMAAGELDPTLTTIGFEDIPAGLERLERGEVSGRLVAEFGG